MTIKLLAITDLANLVLYFQLKCICRAAQGCMAGPAPKVWSLAPEALKYGAHPGLERLAGTSPPYRFSTQGHVLFRSIALEEQLTSLCTCTA